MNDIPINDICYHKHLGVTLSSDGNWDEQIKSMIIKALTRLHIIRKFKFVLDRKSLEKLYLIYIRPILEYGDVV